MCRFVTDNAFDEFPTYQICTCGKHLWNSKSQKVSHIQKNDTFAVYKDGQRHMIKVDTPDAVRVSASFIKNIICPLIFVFLVIACHHCIEFGLFHT